MDIKGLSNEEIVKLVKEGKVGNADINDAGICPTCFNEENDYVLFGNDKDRMIYEDKDFKVFLVSNPRAKGHTVISTKKHYKDMMEIPNATCAKVYILAKRVMNVLKEVYKCESVYLCTMCDGPMNHFHIQLIPRYDFEKRGSKNFVKDRFDYVEEKDKLEELRMKLDYNE